MMIKDQYCAVGIQGFISRCYVVAKCNMQHNALLKVILH